MPGFYDGEVIIIGKLSASSIAWTGGMEYGHLLISLLFTQGYPGDDFWRG